MKKFKVQSNFQRYVQKKEYQAKKWFSYKKKRCCKFVALL